MSTPRGDRRDIESEPGLIARGDVAAAAVVSLIYDRRGVGVLDMFPHTNHVKTMALLVKS